MTARPFTDNDSKNVMFPEQSWYIQHARQDKVTPRWCATTSAGKVMHNQTPRAEAPAAQCPHPPGPFVLLNDQFLEQRLDREGKVETEGIPWLLSYLTPPCCRILPFPHAINGYAAVGRLFTSTATAAVETRRPRHNATLWLYWLLFKHGFFLSYMRFYSYPSMLSFGYLVSMG